jgi:polar amino acid transport system permease protein
VGSSPEPRRSLRDGPGPPAGDRRSRILAPLRAEGAKSVSIAVVSTVVFFTVVVVIVVNSSGWPVVHQRFFNGEIFAQSLPEIARRFAINVQAFLIAEAFILIVALFIAVLRSLPGPVFFPIRALAIAYTDLFRAVPTILVIYILGFGAPGLQLRAVPTSAFFWGVVALILVYSAYVAEVYRAGIESVHPSQIAAARSLGLSRWQSLRFVVIPQAVRRVVPPLLNDFIGLQKDTALLALIGVLETFRRSQVDVAATFNFTPYFATALIFILFTIPLTRAVDWLIARERGRRESGGTV